MSVPLLNDKNDHPKSNGTKNIGEIQVNMDAEEELSSFFAFPPAALSNNDAGKAFKVERGGLTTSANFSKDLQNTESKTRPDTFNQTFKECPEDDHRESFKKDSTMVAPISRFGGMMNYKNNKKITFPELKLDETDELLMLFSSKKQYPLCNKNSPKSSNESMAILD